MTSENFQKSQVRPGANKVPSDEGEGEGEGTIECSRGLTRVLYGNLEAATEARNNINLSAIQVEQPWKSQYKSNNVS